MWIICPYIGILQMFRVSCFTTVNVFISNSCFPEQKSKGNGIAQSWCGIGCTVGPLIGGPLMAWSLNNSLGDPFNYRFPFFIMSLCHIAAGLCAWFLPTTIEKKKEHKHNNNVLSSVHLEMEENNKVKQSPKEDTSNVVMYIMYL